MAASPSPVPAPALPPSSPPAAPAAGLPHFFADLYSFKWSALHLRLPLISASAVAICLFAGILAGHPGGGLVAGGGAFTVGFGANQRIGDSRLIPMMAAVLAISMTTLAGTLAGHRNGWLILAAAVAAFVYGMLTTRHAGLAWVGQQATIAMLVASAFPTGPKAALVRMGLLAAGGTVQILVTSAGLCLMPKLQRDLRTLAASFLSGVRPGDGDLAHRILEIPHALPALARDQAIGYSLRMVLTICLATEMYRQAGVQSGYWIPMTALLVLKPAFFETFSRTSARIAGTLAGAWLCSLLIAHLAPAPAVLAAFTALFAFLAFATNPVNYGLFTACLTGYIVFLLSLNQIPEPMIAHRRAWCTVAGGCIALVVHLIALSRWRRERALS